MTDCVCSIGQVKYHNITTMCTLYGFLLVCVCVSFSLLDTHRLYNMATEIKILGKLEERVVRLVGVFIKGGGDSCN